MKPTLNRFGEPMTNYEWEIYINSPEWKIRYDLAINPSTPVWVLDRMSQDEDIYVLYGLMNNPNITTEILDKIASNGESRGYEFIPYSIIKLPKCSEKTILRHYALNKIKTHIPVRVIK